MTLHHGPGGHTIEVFPMWDRDTTTCREMVRANWGDVSAQRAEEQIYEAFKNPYGKYAPKFVVVAKADDVLGFAGYQRSMKMHGAFDLIWLAVAEQFKGLGVGRALIEHRLAVIRDLGGSHACCVTQKPELFQKFGFTSLEEIGNGWHHMSLHLKPSAME